MMKMPLPGVVGISMVVVNVTVDVGSVGPPKNRVNFYLLAFFKYMRHWWSATRLLLLVGCIPEDKC